MASFFRISFESTPIIAILYATLKAFVSILLISFGYNVLPDNGAQSNTSKEIVINE